MTVKENLTTWLRRLWDAQRRSIRGRLFMTLGGLLLALVVVQSVQYLERAQERREILARGQRDMADADAALVRGQLESLFREEESLGPRLFEQGRARDEANAALQAFVSRHPGVIRVIVSRTDHSALYVVPPAPIPDVKPPDSHQDVDFGSGRMVSRWPVTDADEAQPHLHLTMSIPAPESGSVGDVTVLVRPESFAALFPKPSPPAGATPPEERTSDNAPHEAQILLDENGQLLAHFSTAEDPPSAILRHLNLADARRTGVAIVSARDHGPRYAGGVEAMQLPGWTMICFRSDELLQEELLANTRWYLLVLLVLIAVFTGAALVVLRYSLSPLNQLSGAARKFGSGDLALRLPPTELQELDQLVDAFNRMAEQLSEARRGLLDANHDLERRVLERTRELEEQQQKLIRAERLSTLGLFSSAIAHDLRNPLNTVTLSMYWIKAQLEQWPDERMQHRLDTVQRELKRADRIIQTLLGFARTGEPERAPTNLKLLLDDVLAVIHPTPNVRREVSVSPDLPPVNLDRAQFFQVLENLIRNAVQAMPEGGEVRVTARRHGDHCRISVKDTGPGIPPELHESIFEPLVTTKSTGTGLGLALCHRIVEAHGGRIWVESEPGHGASFEIELPLE